MTIRVNGEERSFAAAESVSGLLAAEGVESPNMVSVQLNGRILDRGNFPSTSLKDGDSVEFLYFMGGGERTASPTANAAAVEIGVLERRMEDR